MTPARIALVNANTTASMTSRIEAFAQAMVAERAICQGITAPEGAPYISTRETADAAARIVEKMVDTIEADALVISCFGDPGLFAARKKLTIPVIGMADASCHVATQLGDRFSIITGGRAWGPMLTEFVERIGLSSRFAGVETLELTGDMIAADPAGAETMVLAEVEAARRSGADTVILGGAGLIGFAARLQPRADIRLLDSLECAVSQACAMLQLARPRP